MSEMRTTLTLDDDLAGLLKQRAREPGIPFKEAMNQTIRAGIGEGHRDPTLSGAEDNFPFLRVQAGYRSRQTRAARG